MNGKQFRFVDYFLALCAIISSIACITACSQKVNKVILNSISVTPVSPPNLSVSYTQGFDATATYSDGSTAAVSTQALWRSSDTGIATINSSGYAKGVSAGTTKITATFDGITSSPIILTVITLSSISVEPTSTSNIEIGSTEQFTAIGNNWDGSTINITSQVTWASNDNNVAAIDSTGLATAISNGTAKITASYEGITSQTVFLNVMSLTSQ